MADIGTIIGPSGQLAHHAFVEARAFYKKGKKSSNKIYGSDAEADDVDMAQITVARERAQRRNDSAGYDAGPEIQELRARLTGQKRILKGQFCRDSRLTAGNCGDMTNVALAYAYDRAGASPAPGMELWTVTTTGFEHEFMLVGTGPGIEDRHTIGLAGFPAIAGTSLYVCDVWAGICCVANEYLARFCSQMMKWGGQGKHIGVPRPNNQAIWIAATDAIPLFMAAQGKVKRQSV